MCGLKVSGQNFGAFKVVLVVKNPLPVQEGSVLSLGWEEPLEEGMATHSSTIAWRIPWPDKPGGLQSIGLRSQTQLTQQQQQQHGSFISSFFKESLYCSP